MSVASPSLAVPAGGPIVVILLLALFFAAWWGLGMLEGTGAAMNGAWRQ